MTLTIVKPGMLTTVQDLGRHGFRHYGVPSGGAVDEVSFVLANLLVGNPPGAAALEMTMLGPTVRFDRPVRVALCGADADAEVAGARLPWWRPVDLPRGAEIRIGALERGARAYLAIDGGITVKSVMGSSATDLRGGFGGADGRALSAGAELALGGRRTDVAADQMQSVPWYVDPRPDLVLDGPIAIGVLSAADELTEPDALNAAEWNVSVDSNRQALRLVGPPLTLQVPGERVSEPVVPGTVQMPPTGLPIVLLADAQTVGGYPRIGHVQSTDLPRLGQARPGDVLRFHRVDAAAAAAAACERRERLARLAGAIGERLLGT